MKKLLIGALALTIMSGSAATAQSDHRADGHHHGWRMTVETATIGGVVNAWATTTIQTGRSDDDAVSNILKWILLLVTIATFAGLGLATWETYRAAPPQPDNATVGLLRQFGRGS